MDVPRCTVAPFRVDVTPPLSHPLCGGWITPAAEIVDRQWANGLVLRGAGSPVVLAAVDWCEIRNAGYDRWRALLAEACETDAARVFVSCVHPHDAPFADPEAERLLREHGAPGTSLDLEFFERAARSVADAARAAVPEPVTHVSTGRARVAEVASNRRVNRGPDGRVGAMRGSSCRDPALRALPEGLIDPWLRSIGLWQGERLVTALHSYATHPMSHYGRGAVSCDFCGLARDAFAAAAGGAHLYLTGGAGNIGAGRYNDGSPENRPLLMQRVLAAMREAHAAAEHQPLQRLDWLAEPARLPTRLEFTRTYYRELLEDAGASHAARYRGATGLSWLDRVEGGHAIDVGCLVLNDARLLCLPGEPFVEYQLHAQELRPDRFVAMAGYGDCGPGYLPTAEAYPEGGYEAGWAALVAPEADGVLRGTMSRLLERAG